MFFFFFFFSSRRRHTRLQGDWSSDVCSSDLVGVNKPHNMRMAVDLPAPLGPRNPKISPFFTARETSSTATNEPNFFTRLRVSTEFMPAPPLPPHESSG